MCQAPQVRYRGTKPVPSLSYKIPEEEPPPRTAFGHILYAVQDFFVTNLHWYWLIGLFGSLFVYGPLSRAFLINVAFTLLPLVLVPGSAKRRLHEFQRPILSEFFREARVIAHAPPASYTNGKRCLFAIAPHGALPIGFWPLTFVAHEMFCNTCIFVASHVMIIPFYKLLLAARGGALSASKTSMKAVMKAGEVNAMLYPGGLHEMFLCQPRAKQINISRRHKGFVKMAIDSGYDLVPILSFSSNDDYDNFFQWSQKATYKWFKVPLAPPYYTNRWYFPSTNKVPLRVAVGERIVTTPTSSVDELHAAFYEELARLFELHKEEWGYGHRELHFVD